MGKTYYVYIATNKNDTVLYTGVTNNLERRMREHANKLISGFTSKYNIGKLIWYQEFNTPQEAITAEKRIKGWRREKKIKLIEEMNPEFVDLLRGDPSLRSGMTLSRVIPSVTRNPRDSSLRSE